MNKLTTLLLAALATLSVGPALAETNVGVSIGIHQPGVCDRIE